MVVMAKDSERMGGCRDGFSLGQIEPGGAVGVVDREWCLFPKAMVLTLKEEEVVVVLGATQPVVGAGLGVGSGVSMALFLGAMANLGRKAVVM